MRLVGNSLIWNDMRKWIGYYQNIVSDSLCDKLINYSDNQKTLQPSTYSTSSGKSERSNQRVKMDDRPGFNGETYYNDIKNCFMTVIKKYRDKHEDFVCQRHTDFRMNKYSEGGFMSRYVDNIHAPHEQEYGYPQTSALLFLNDDYEGGHFHISGLRYETKGSAIIFPS